MNWSKLFSHFFGSKHVKPVEKLAPKHTYTPPIRTYTYSNPLEYSCELEKIQSYTSKDLHGGLGARIFTYMIDNNALISSCLDNVTDCIAEAVWKLENDETPQETMQLFEELLEKIDFSNNIKDMLSFVGYGWSAMEIIFGKPKGNNLPIVELLAIRQGSLEHWVHDKSGKIVGIKLLDREQAIPIENLLLFRDRPNGSSMEGKGKLRACFPLFKELIDLKRQQCASPNFVKAYVPKELLNYASQTEDDISVGQAKQTLNDLSRIIESLSRGRAASYILASDVQTIFDGENEKAINTKQYDIEVHPLTINKDVNLLENIKHIEQQIIIAMSMEHRLIGSGETGSKSSGEVHKSTLETALSSYCKIISTEMKRQLFTVFAQENGIKTEHIPNLVASDIDKSNINFKINAIQTVIHACEKGFPEIARDLARDANLPEEDIEDKEELELEKDISEEVDISDLNIQNPGQRLKHE